MILTYDLSALYQPHDIRNEKSVRSYHMGRLEKWKQWIHQGSMESMDWPLKAALTLNGLLQDPRPTTPLSMYHSP